MIELQKYIKKYGLDKLKTNFGIKTIFSQKYPELVLLKYDQIESPMGETEVQQSRGIILNTLDNFKIISRPFDKFFNYKEGHAADINWNTATCFDKRDGSMMCLYKYKDTWNVQTSGNPDAAGIVFGNEFTFNELFWQVWDKLEYSLPHNIHENLNFIFELETPYNKVVVDHKKNQLVLIGIRDKITGEEFDIRTFTDFNYKKCPTYSLNNIEDILKCAKELNPLENEGYVIVDQQFNRIKVKSPAYVALHHMKDRMTPRKMIAICLSNESEEVLSYFPEYKEIYDKVQNKLNLFKNNINQKYFKYKEMLPDFKSIALANKNYKHLGLLMGMLRNNNTIEEILIGKPLKSIEKLIEN